MLAYRAMVHFPSGDLPQPCDVQYGILANPPPAQRVPNDTDVPTTPYLQHLQPGLVQRFGFVQRAGEEVQEEPTRAFLVYIPPLPRSEALMGHPRYQPQCTFSGPCEKREAGAHTEYERYQRNPAHQTMKERAMTTLERDHRPICPYCGGDLRKKLCDDLPGLHTYIWVCDVSQREYGPEWEEHHQTSVRYC